VPDSSSSGRTRGLSFHNAWNDRFDVAIGDLAVPFLGRASLVRNKRAAGRFKDLADNEALGESIEPEE
jgi:hypothetical protein